MKAILVGGVLVFALWLNGCSDRPVATFSSKQLESAIVSGASLSMAAVFVRPWDAVLMVTPYTSQERIAERVGRRLPQSGIDVLDSFLLLVFTEADEVVAIAEVSRSAVADIRGVGDGPIRRQNAVFQIEKSDGRVVLQLEGHN